MDQSVNTPMALRIVGWRALEISLSVNLDQILVPRARRLPADLSNFAVGGYLTVNMAFGDAWVATDGRDGSKFLLHRMHACHRRKEALQLAQEVGELEAMQMHCPQLLKVMGAVKPDACFDGSALLSEPVEATLAALLGSALPLSWPPFLSHVAPAKAICSSGGRHA